MGYSFRLAAMVLLYAPSHRQDSTYHGLCYTSRGALAGTRNSSMGPPHEGSIRPRSVIGKEAKKEIFLTLYITHFILQLFRGIIQIVKGKTRCRHHMDYSFRLTARDFCMHHPVDRIAHITAFVIPEVVHWLKRETLGDRPDDPSHRERAL